jgi:hypothetical protein
MIIFFKTKPPEVFASPKQWAKRAQTMRNARRGVDGKPPFDVKKRLRGIIKEIDGGVK